MRRGGLDGARDELQGGGVELTLQRKVSIAAVTLALGFLAFDSLSPGGSGLGPASAGAAQSPPAAAAAPAVAARQAAPSLRQRLEQARKGLKEPASDGFATPEAWLKGPPESENESTARSPAQRSADLSAAHRLTGVSLGARPLVVIDGSAYSPGMSLHGITLRSIAKDGRSVEIEAGGVVATLHLDTPPRSGGR